VSDDVGLRDIAGAYRRVLARIYRILEDGYDFTADDRIIATLDRDALVIDAAFFLLIFGQVENRLNELAARRAGGDGARQAAVREAKFTRRLALALPGENYRPLRAEIAAWYDLRSDAAHGERLTSGYEVALALQRAFELDAMVQKEADAP
jgi:hypothetical protein